MNVETHRCGYAALIGRPNVGKSTLLNCFLGQKLAAVTPLAQTTRNRIFGIYDREDCQIIFQDTPGILQPSDELHAFMLREANRALDDADVAVWLIDGVKKVTEGDRKMVEKALQDRAMPLLIGVNKVDAVPLAQRAALQESLAKLQDIPEENIYYLSALHGDGTQTLLERIESHLPLGPKFYPPDQLSDRTQRFFIEEIIREKAFMRLREEAPYSLAVIIDEMTERENGAAYIQASLHVERDSQKGILLGKGGRMIKSIGMEARKDIEPLLGGPVYLELWVRVTKKWRKNQGRLREFGYSDPA